MIFLYFWQGFSDLSKTKLLCLIFLSFFELVNDGPKEEKLATKPRTEGQL